MLFVSNKFKSFSFIVVTFMLLSVSFATALDGYGSKKVNEQFTFCQVCSDSTYITLSSIETPNSTTYVNSNMTAMGGGDYCYNYTPLYVGRYDFRGISDGCENTFATFVDVTSTGKPTPNGIPSFYGVLLIIIFGVSVFFLFFSMKLNEVGPKIFFMVASFIFLLATMMTAYQLSAEFNLANNLNTTTGALVFVLAMILLIIFLYILIRQTVVILDMYKVNKGLAWPGGQSVTGYRQNNWQY